MVNGAKRALLITAVIGLSLAATGCREDEQGRPMVKQKGVYEGPADEALDEERLLDLRSRASGQKF
jgi:hypothetical protein